MISYKAQVNHEGGYDIQLHTDDFDTYKLIEAVIQKCVDADRTVMLNVDPNSQLGMLMKKCEVT